MGGLRATAPATDANADRLARRSQHKGERNPHILLSLQTLRAIAALSVTLAHIPNVSLILPQARYGAVGVDIFFVISGFIMVDSSKDLFQHPNGLRIFLLRRLARIVPLYWLITVVWFVRAGVGPHMTVQRLTWFLESRVLACFSYWLSYI